MSKNKLIIEMTIFTAFLFVSFSCIIINQKGKEYLTPKAHEKTEKYVKNKYSDIIDDVKVEKTIYNQRNDTFDTKIVNKNNKNLYFTVSYRKKKYTSTFNKDYLDGQTLLNYYKATFEKELNSKKNKTISVTFRKKLNNYNTAVKKALIANDNVKNLNIYNISINTNSKDLSQKNIMSNITKYYKYINKNGYNPKYYNFDIINKKDISKELKIKYLDENLINNNLNEIIGAIIANDSSIESKYSIKYKFID